MTEPAEMTDEQLLAAVKEQRLREIAVQNAANQTYLEQFSDLIDLGLGTDSINPLIDALKAFRDTSSRMPEDLYSPANAAVLGLCMLHERIKSKLVPIV